MRLPAYLLSLLAVGSLSPLAGCAAEPDPSQEDIQDEAAPNGQAALRNQAVNETAASAAADAGPSPVVTPANSVPAADAGAVVVLPVPSNLPSPPANDPCPGCGLG